MATAARKKKVRGKGIVNWMVKHVPFEMHIPGYQYCGPGTKLKKRLARNDPGINELDRACKEHDISYSKFKTTGERNIADKILAEKAWERAKASDSSISERAAALAISSIMNTKASLGMGLGKKISAFFNHKYRGGCLGGCSNKRGKGVKKATAAAAAVAGTTTTTKKKKKKKAKKTKAKKPKKLSAKAIFRDAKAKAKEAIRKKGVRTVDKAAEVAERAASTAVGRIFKKTKQAPISPLEVEEELRVIPVPKQGAALPLIPIFAGLSALGALMGGSASIANAAVSASRAKKDLSEAQRHNQAMEAIAIGKNSNTGSGLYLRPYKSGLGLFLTPNPPLQQQQQQHQQKNL